MSAREIGALALAALLILTIIQSVIAGLTPDSVGRYPGLSVTRHDDGTSTYDYDTGQTCTVEQALGPCEDYTP